MQPCLTSGLCQASTHRQVQHPCSAAGSEVNVRTLISKLRWTKEAQGGLITQHWDSELRDGLLSLLADNAPRYVATVHCTMRHLLDIRRYAQPVHSFNACALEAATWSHASE